MKFLQLHIYVLHNTWKLYVPNKWWVCFLGYQPVLMLRDLGELKSLLFVVFPRTKERVGICSPLGLVESGSRWSPGFCACCLCQETGPWWVSYASTAAARRTSQHHWVPGTDWEPVPLPPLSSRRTQASSIAMLQWVSVGLWGRGHAGLDSETVEEVAIIAG